MKKRAKLLSRIGTLRLPMKRPFNFRLTFWKPSHFATSLEVHSATRSWRTFRFGDRIYGVRFEGARDHIKATVFSNKRWREEDRTRLTLRIERAYGLSEDLGSFIKKASHEAGLSKSVRILKGMRMSCPESLFEISIICLLLQNTTISRSTQMMRNVLMRYGQPVRFDGKTLLSFPSPADLAGVSENELRSDCRLGYRAKYLPAFAQFFQNVDDDELRGQRRDVILEQLQRVKGVGPYTAGVISSHALRDPDALSLDVWNTKLMSEAFFGTPATPRSRIESYLRRRLPGMAGLALLYITEFRYLDQPLFPMLDHGRGSRKKSRRPTHRSKHPSRSPIG